jgi:hypothetical protein
MMGVIERPGSSTVGVKINGTYNNASSYGVYWFGKGEVNLVKPLEHMLAEVQEQPDDICMSTKGFSVIDREVVSPSAARGYTVADGMVDIAKANKMEEFEMEMKLVELAKERDLKAAADTVIVTINQLLDADDVISALNVKRINEEKKPLEYMQKIQLACEETTKLIRKAQDEKKDEEFAIEKKYNELYAALELPEVNVIEVLKAAGILNEAGTGLA